MAYTFTLCSGCGDKYRALAFDPTCKLHLCPMPLNSLVWPDEHPERFGFFMNCCAPCKESIRRLSYARTHLWRLGEIPADHVELWTQAQNIVPNWPGFKRLSLTEDELKSLDACNDELNDVMRSIGESFPAIKFTNKGGGQVHFSASRTKEPKLIAPRSGSKAGIGLATKPYIMRCPSCREFIDASTRRCRFCNRILQTDEIDAAIALREEKKSLDTHKKVRRSQTSTLLTLVAAGILFIPAARPGSVIIKYLAVALLMGLSIANRKR